jgi:class 3 adenylate cyclase
MLRNESPDENPRSVEAIASRLDAAHSTSEIEEAIRALAAAANMPPDAIERTIADIERKERRKETRWGRFVQQLREMDYATRRIVAGAFLGLQFGLLEIASRVFGDRYGLGLLGMIIVAALALLNTAVTRTAGIGLFSGAAFGLAVAIGYSFFSMVFRAPGTVEGAVVIPLVLLCGLGGLILGKFSDRITRLRLQADPIKRREHLLRQLVDLQDELKKGEKLVAFLSVDVVGSTRIKETSEPLASEFTFTEYTSFVRDAAGRYGGQIHSTAGDGVLLAFEDPKQAFAAARHLQAAILEFNAFRNRTGQPFELRCGLHAGLVMAPAGQPTAVNYSHVIDVSSHAQRVAPIGGIAVTQEACAFLPGGPKAVGRESVGVQGTQVAIWKPPQAEESAGGVAELPPPPPALPT